MEKNGEIFDQWNSEKKYIDTTSLYVFAKPRDVCYIKLWCNIWSEENGKREFLRPVLIINKIWSLYFVIPLTSKEKHNKYHRKLISVSFNNNYSFLILSQWRIIDGRRLIEKVGKCEYNEFLDIKKILRKMYFPE